MIEYDYITNGNKIFNEDYMYKILLKGYMINNKYPDGKFTEKEIIMFLESHSKKYQFKINYFVKNNLLDSVEMNLEQFDSYEIPIYKIGLVDQFYYITKNEKISVLPLSRLDKEKQMIFFNKEIKIEEGDCLISDNYLVLLQDIGINKHPFITKNFDIDVNYSDFAKNILTDKEFEKYREDYFNKK